MKIIRYISVCIIILLLFGYSIASLNRNISIANDNYYTLIRNSKGNYWGAVSSNIQIAINDLDNNSGTVWLPGGRTFYLTETIIVWKNILLDLGGSELKLPNGVDCNVVELKDGSGIKNGVIDVSGFSYRGGTWDYNPTSNTSFNSPHACIYLNASSYINSALIENMALSSLSDGYDNIIGNVMYVYFNSFANNNDWDNPSYLTDSSDSTYATGSLGDTILLDGNDENPSHESGYYGSHEPIRIYLQACVSYSGDSGNKIKLTPIYSGGAGTENEITITTGSATWVYPLIPLTTDTNAPATWTWSDIKNLDCYTNVSAAPGTLKVHRIRLIVVTSSPAKYYSYNYSGRGAAIYFHATNSSVPQRISNVSTNFVFMRNFRNGIYIHNERHPIGDEDGAYIEMNSFGHISFHAVSWGINMSRDNTAPKDKCSVSYNTLNMWFGQTGHPSAATADGLTWGGIHLEGSYNTVDNGILWDFSDSHEYKRTVGIPGQGMNFTDDAEYCYINTLMAAGYWNFNDASNNIAIPQVGSNDYQYRVGEIYELDTEPPEPPEEGLYEYFDGIRIDYSSFSYWMGQTFTVGCTGDNVTHNMTGASFRLSRQADNPPGLVILRIKAVDGNGLPTGPDLATGNIDGSILPTGAGDPGIWTRINLTTPCTLTAGTQYAMILNTTDTYAYVHLGDGYTGGQLVFTYTNAPPWSYLSTRDLLFKEYGEVI